jgi:hypothetical protein
MLSGKPLGGYRCMACDRPLAALDSRPGPYLPTGQLPVSLASGAEVAVAAGQALGKVRLARVCLQLLRRSVTGLLVCCRQMRLRLLLTPMLTDIPSGACVGMST